jgi:oligopeptide/dipeptide ABC transporter ATP-binding protein
LRQPLHPYTRALLQCVGREDHPAALTTGKHPVPTIPGSPPDLRRTGFACDFKERCPDRMDVCSTRIPPDSQASGTHRIACFKFGS